MCVILVNIMGSHLLKSYSFLISSYSRSSLMQRQVAPTHALNGVKPKTPRADDPGSFFFEVNCAVLPAKILEIYYLVKCFPIALPTACLCCMI